MKRDGNLKSKRSASILSGSKHPRPFVCLRVSFLDAVLSPLRDVVILMPWIKNVINKKTKIYSTVYGSSIPKFHIIRTLGYRLFSTVALFFSFVDIYACLMFVRDGIYNSPIFSAAFEMFYARNHNQIGRTTICTHIIVHVDVIFVLFHFIFLLKIQFFFFFADHPVSEGRVVKKIIHAEVFYIRISCLSIFAFVYRRKDIFYFLLLFLSR